MQRIGHFLQQSIDIETDPIERDMREELVSEVLWNLIVRLICFHGCWKIEEYTHLPVLVKLKSKTKQNTLETEGPCNL